MDVLSTPNTTEERKELKKHISDDASGLVNYVWPFLNPLRLLVDLIAAGLRLIKPFTPQLVPFIVFLCALPVIGALSFSAGYLVWKSVAVGWETQLYLNYGDGVAPYAEVTLPGLVAQQPYDISLHLIVPASESNFVLGNFMTTLTLITSANKTLTTVRRPAIVLPPLSSPWSLFYNRPGTVDLWIPLVTSFVSPTSRLLAKVELGRQDQWRSIGNGEGRELSVLSTLLRGVVVHKGVRGLINRFPLVSALFAGGTFFFISFVILASCLLPAIEWRFRDDTVDTHDEKIPKPARRRVSQEVNYPRSPKTPRRYSTQTGRRVSEIKEEPKQEESILSMPPATPSDSQGSPPLRRRRSRISQPSDSDAEN